MLVTMSSVQSTEMFTTFLADRMGCLPDGWVVRLYKRKPGHGPLWVLLLESAKLEKLK